MSGSISDVDTEVRELASEDDSGDTLARIPTTCSLLDLVDFQVAAKPRCPSCQKKKLSYPITILIFIKLREEVKALPRIQGKNRCRTRRSTTNPTALVGRRLDWRRGRGRSNESALRRSDWVC